MTDNGGTIPAELTITTDKPDIVIMDRKKKKVDIFELTVPFESNINTRNLHKSNKYAYLLQDITSFSPSVTAFEIGVRGFVTSFSRERLKKIYSYCDSKIKFNTFLQNISAISINSSYYIFTCRKEPTWSITTPLGAPF